MTVQFNEEKQKQKIEEIKRKEEEEFAEGLGKRSGLSYLDLSRLPINTDALKIVPEETARAAEAVVFNATGKKIQIAIQSPTNEKLAALVEELKGKGYLPELIVVSGTSLAKAFDSYKIIAHANESRAGAVEISNEAMTKLLPALHSISDIANGLTEILAAKKTYLVSQLIELILSGALATKASDIHIEPEEEYARLRFRLDGILNDVFRFDRTIFAHILSRVKLLSGLKLNIRNVAQDGRFSVKLGDTEIEIRSSLLPGAYSESIVLRVLNPKSISVPLQDLGIPPRLLAIVLHEIEKPNGMILTTGPTGSGKTTTLYAFLKKVHTPEIKIITIEDPIEYHLPGIVQTQTNAEKGYTFVSGLRSALRQDPDIIMVGEIRDNETAEIAVNAALTGHLVFSTLHTNTAAGTFPRLIDLGVNPKTMTSAVHIALAQRLVRKLCPDCKKEAPIGGADKKIIDRVIADLPEAERKSVTNVTTMWVEVGCEKCNNTGFRGRIGLYEGVLADEKIEKIVRENPSEREIREAARAQGILTIAEDGVLKVLAGITSLKEVERAVDLGSNEVGGE